MSFTRLKYSMDLSSEFIDYVGLGSYTPNLQEGLSYYYYQIRTESQWRSFFKTQSDCIVFYVMANFWWNYKENQIEPVEFPGEFLNNFKCNFEFIEAILNKYLVFEELPPPSFKYLDFIEGNQSFLEIVNEEKISIDLVCLTFDSDERVFISHVDELRQIFIPEDIYPEFKRDLKDLVGLICT